MRQLKVTSLQASRLVWNLELVGRIVDGRGDEVAALVYSPSANKYYVVSWNEVDGPFVYIFPAYNLAAEWFLEYLRDLGDGIVMLNRPLWFCYYHSKNPKVTDDYCFRAGPMPTWELGERIDLREAMNYVYHE